MIVSSPNTSFNFTTDIFEGIYVQDSYVFVTTNDEPYPRFRINNRSVDSESLTVAVYEDGADIATIYKLSKSLLGLNKNSTVFFLQAGDDAYFEVQFGDGNIGRKPKEGSLLVLDYRVCNFDRANGATQFSINFDPTGSLSELSSAQSNNPNTITLLNATGGASPEDIESVRYYAPRWYQTQERAVTAQDYAILLKTQFPEINAVAVYGGEDENPPQFGKVIISIDVSDVDGVPASKQQEYYAYLKQRCPLSIDPIFKDPLFTYLQVNSTVRYNLNVTSSSIDRIKTLVTNTITKYNKARLDDFNVTVRYSALVRLIDASDTSIISNLTALRLYKKTQPGLNVPQSFALDFGVALNQEPASLTNNDRKRTVTSTMFTYKGDLVTLQDDGNGTLYIVKNVGSSYSQIQEVGKVNYATGLVSVQAMVIDGYNGDYLKIYAIPNDRDIQSVQRNILSIEPDEIKINVQPLRV
jgi:hypothetical protein